MTSKSSGKNIYAILFWIIVISSVSIRMIIGSSLHGSALLYIGVPTAIAAVLLHFVKVEDTSWKGYYARLCLYSLIIMLGSSVVLFEGFLCVVMFMPIYFFVILVMFLIRVFKERSKSESKLHFHILPLILVVASLEGTSPELSFNRYNEVVVTATVSASAAQIKRNLMKPVVFDQKRNWFISLFPMPYQMKANALEVGEVHEIKYRYHRWFVANTHEGYTKLLVAKSSDQHIKMRVVEDTSYLSHYLKLHGSEVDLTPINAQKTKVNLTIKYDRLLDPAWYFDPLQRYATSVFGRYLIKIMMSNHGKSSAK